MADGVRIQAADSRLKERPAAQACVSLHVSPAVATRADPSSHHSRTRGAQHHQAGGIGKGVFGHRVHVLLRPTVGHRREPHRDQVLPMVRGRQVQQCSVVVVVAWHRHEAHRDQVLPMVRGRQKRSVGG